VPAIGPWRKLGVSKSFFRSLVSAISKGYRGTGVNKKLSGGLGLVGLVAEMLSRASNRSSSFAAELKIAEWRPPCV